jgi:hypothetical protein
MYKQIVETEHVFKDVIEDSITYNADRSKKYYLVLEKYYIDSPREYAQSKLLVDPNNRYLNAEINKNEVQDTDIKIPVYAFVHSGIILSTSPFSCPWDSGLIGYLVFPQEVENPLEVAKSELKEFNYYLSGECYGVVTEELDSNGDTVDYEVVSQILGYDEAMEFIRLEVIND